MTELHKPDGWYLVGPGFEVGPFGSEALMNEFREWVNNRETTCTL